MTPPDKMKEMLECWYERSRQERIRKLGPRLPRAQPRTFTFQNAAPQATFGRGNAFRNVSH